MQEGGWAVYIVGGTEVGSSGPLKKSARLAQLSLKRSRVREEGERGERGCSVGRA